MSARPNDLLQFTDKGIYCPQADVFLDPRRKVEKAIISHAHSDHARYGCSSYLSSAESEAPLRLRLGNNIQLETLEYGKGVVINGVNFSFFPAGHVIGSSQIRVEYKGEVWVYTGDFKLEDDGFSTPYENVTCHTFITESTFGLPVYKWQNQNLIYKEINDWWRFNASRGICSIITAYSLGKAQRVLCHLDQSIGHVYTHSAITTMNQALVDFGFSLPKHQALAAKHVKGNDDLNSAIIIMPPASSSASWLNSIKQVSFAVASGWMAIRGSRRRMSVDKGFALSDHADWPSLNKAVKDTGAERVIVTHGYKESFAQWLREQGYDAEPSASDYFSRTESADQ